MVGMWLYVGRPGCDTACVRQGIVISGILAAGLAILLAHWLSQRLNRPAAKPRKHWPIKYAMANITAISSPANRMKWDSLSMRLTRWPNGWMNG